MKEKRYVYPLEELGGKLLKVEKPARYVGGEIGILAKKEKPFQTLIAFPDLYEIGMGNQALRIIYNSLNSKPDISCDRSFAPAPDYEKLLRENNIPLYGLDTGISLASVDLLMFTLGYELGLNGILTMLEACTIPLHCNNRKNNPEYPIIIAGGPAISNPLPYSPFIDAFWIGEAEAGFFDMACELSDLKKSGQGRAAMMERIASHPNVWVKGKEKAKRAIAMDFSEGCGNANAAVYPVPSMKVVQNHGTVEIMRGCPNGCRFCHAGFWYRPQRQKSMQLIASQVSQTAALGGWQEISLSSLSSGDYSGIGELIEKLNQQFSDLHISFQLPSLKVSGFSLSILEKISLTRKSGLTFAVETPLEAWQMAVNKEVTRDSVTAILEEAKKRGWKGAKFYFMIGLPVNYEKLSTNNEKIILSEEEEIVSFISDVGRRSRFHFNINVGVFIPKPHTPYQWAEQMDSETAEKKLAYIRSRLKPLGHKVSISDSLISRIEGLLSRGDERSGFLCEEAWKNGSRLDPWSEYINKEKWTEIMDKNSVYIESIFSAKAEKEHWECIESGVTTEYLKKELQKSNNAQRTPACICQEKCYKCGICNCRFIKSPAQCSADKSSSFVKQDHKSNLCFSQVNENNSVNTNNNEVNKICDKKPDPSIHRILFSFCKEGTAVFHGHLSLIEIFSMSFRRANIPVMYTQGFNPLAKMEFASPLSVGISAKREIAVVNFLERISTESFIDSLNKSLPQGFSIEKAENFYIKSGMKKHSVSSLLWGFAYDNNEKPDYVRVKDEKLYRQNRLSENCKTLFELKRVEVLAKNIISNDMTSNEWLSYFDVYNFLYNA